MGYRRGKNRAVVGLLPAPGLALNHRCHSNVDTADTRPQRVVPLCSPVHGNTHSRPACGYLAVQAKPVRKHGGVNGYNKEVDGGQLHQGGRSASYLRSTTLKRCMTVTFASSATRGN